MLPQGENLMSSLSLPHALRFQTDPKSLHAQFGRLWIVPKGVLSDIILTEEKLITNPFSRSQPNQGRHGREAGNG